jgi:hypothetical protein
MATYVDPEEFLGSLDNTVQFIDDNKTVLTAKGVATDTVKAGVKALRDGHFAKRTERDKKKTELQLAQKDYADSGTNNYRDFSDYVDLLAGAVGKSTPAGKKMLGYRQNVTGSNRPDKKTDAGADASK